jgi:hypothetical protein
MHSEEKSMPFSPSSQPEPRGLTIGLCLALAALTGAQSVTSLGDDHLRRADLIVLGPVAQVRPIGNGVVLLQIEPEEILKGEVRDPASPVGVFLYASYGYEAGPRRFVFLLERQGRGGRYRLIDSFAVEEEGLQRLACLREFIALEQPTEPLQVRIQKARDLHLRHLTSEHRWNRWNGVRELRWLLARFPDSFSADDLEVIDGAVATYEEPELQRLAAALANQVRRALLLPISPEQLALERLPARSRPPAGSLAELPPARSAPRRIVRPGEPEETPFDYGEEQLGPGGYASLVRDPDVHHQRRVPPPHESPAVEEPFAGPELPAWAEDEASEPRRPESLEPLPEEPEAPRDQHDLEALVDRFVVASDPAQRVAILAGLRDVPPEQLDRAGLGDVLRAGLVDEAFRVQQEAIRTVVHFQVTSALEVLRVLARDSAVSTVVRLEAIRALGLLGDHDSLTLLDALADTRLLGPEALTAIRRLDTPAALDTLAGIRDRHGGPAGPDRRVRKIIEHLLSPEWQP